jgi:hypothetical protein
MNEAKLLPLPIHELVTMYLYVNISIQKIYCLRKYKRPV